MTATAAERTENKQINVKGKELEELRRQSDARQQRVMELSVPLGVLGRDCRTERDRERHAPGRVAQRYRRELKALISDLLQSEKELRHSTEEARQLEAQRHELLKQKRKLMLALGHGDDGDNADLPPVREEVQQLLEAEQALASAEDEQRKLKERLASLEPGARELEDEPTYPKSAQEMSRDRQSLGATKVDPNDPKERRVVATAVAVAEPVRAEPILAQAVVAEPVQAEPTRAEPLESRSFADAVPTRGRVGGVPRGARARYEPDAEASLLLTGSRAAEEVVPQRVLSNRADLCTTRVREFDPTMWVELASALGYPPDVDVSNPASAGRFLLSHIKSSVLGQQAQAGHGAPMTPTPQVPYLASGQGAPWNGPGNPMQGANGRGFMPSFGFAQ